MTFSPKDIEDIAMCIAHLHILAEEKKVKDRAGNLQLSLVHVNRVFGFLVGNRTSSRTASRGWKAPEDSIDPNLSSMDFIQMVDDAKERIKKRVKKIG